MVQQLVSSNSHWVAQCFSHTPGVSDQARDDEHGRLLGTFSHFSYQRSDRRLLVTDNQGHCVVSGAHATYTLTDPAVHVLHNDFRDLVHELDANNGTQGEEDFKMGHTCNEWCRFLGLDEISLSYCNAIFAKIACE